MGQELLKRGKSNAQRRRQGGVNQGVFSSKEKAHEGKYPLRTGRKVTRLIDEGSLVGREEKKKRGILEKCGLIFK